MMNTSNKLNGKIVNPYLRSRIKPKTSNKKNKCKITNYFTSLRTSSKSENSDNSVHITNGTDISTNDNTSDIIIDLSSPSPKQDVKPFNGITNQPPSPSICTRSQSQRLKDNMILHEKSPKKISTQEDTHTQVNGVAPLSDAAKPSPSPTKQMRTPIVSPNAKESDVIDLTSSSPPSGSLTPHKIQALNEAKLRLHSPLSNSCISKLKVSPRRLKFSKPVMCAKQKSTCENGPLTNTSNSSCKTAVVDNMTKPMINGALKNNCKPTMKNSQVTQFLPIRRSHRKPKTTLLHEKEKEIEEKILSGKEEGLAVECFHSKGRGVKTTRFFRKGEMVVEYMGDLIDMKEAKERETKYSLDTTKGCYMYYFTYQNTQYCIDATEESGYLGRLVNHSRNGNLATKTVEVKGRPHLILLAKKDIEPGTEILYDYGDRSKQSLLHHPWLAL